MSAERQSEKYAKDLIMKKYSNLVFREYEPNGMDKFPDYSLFDGEENVYLEVTQGIWFTINKSGKKIDRRPNDYQSLQYRLNIAMSNMLKPEESMLLILSDYDLKIKEIDRLISYLKAAYCSNTLALNKDHHFSLVMKGDMKSSIVSKEFWQAKYSNQDKFFDAAKANNVESKGISYEDTDEEYKEFKLPNRLAVQVRLFNGKNKLCMISKIVSSHNNLLKESKLEAQAKYILENCIEKKVSKSLGMLAENTVWLAIVDTNSVIPIDLYVMVAKQLNISKYGFKKVLLIYDDHVTDLVESII